MARNNPNIVLIVADQLAAPFLRVYGHKVVRTPHIDALAERGATFENAYSPSPLCAPARATLMSGLLPGKTGVYDNAAEFPSSIPTFAHYLRLLGYRTCLSGKMHFVGPDQLHGFEERLTTDIYPADFGWTPDWSRPEARIDWWYHNMSSVKQAGTAEITNQLEYDDEVAFLAQRKIYDYARYHSEEPFCLTVSFTHPHDPYVARPAFWNLYRDDQIDPPRTPPIPRQELDAHSRRLYDMAEMGRLPISEADVLRSRHGYYASISYIDSLIGNLIETLAQCGLSDSTAVMLTSDHGDFLGERGLWYKMSFLEPAARIPFIVSMPGMPRGVRVTQPVSLADVLPTLCDVATWGKSEFARPLDGASRFDLISGSSKSDDGHIFGEYLAEGAIAPIYMLRESSWKFIASGPDPDQLYDLSRDPQEVDNLATAPSQAGRVKDYKKRIEARFDSDATRLQVMTSQKCRHFLFEALKRGHYFPWDFQPLRDASEQYTRNRMGVTERDELSRFPRQGES
jgi:choline-sulfatase